MVKVFLITLPGVLSMVIVGCSVAGGNPVGEPKVAVKVAESEKESAPEVRIYEVFGMGCPGCVGGLCKLVRKVPGVQECDGDWKEKRLRVIVSRGAELDDSEIEDAIERANFTLGKRLK